MQKNSIMITLIRVLIAIFLLLPAMLVGILSSFVFLKWIFIPYLSNIYGSYASAVEAVILGTGGGGSPAMAAGLFAVILPWSAKTKPLNSRARYGLYGIFLTVILSISFALWMQGGIGAALASVGPAFIVRYLIFGEFYKEVS